MSDNPEFFKDFAELLTGVQGIQPQLNDEDSADLEKARDLLRQIYSRHGMIWKEVRIYPPLKFKNQS
jgi:hypothetical protein